MPYKLKSLERNSKMGHSDESAVLRMGEAAHGQLLLNLGDALAPPLGELAKPSGFD